MSTALREYQRLEATGLWRASEDAQRRDVIVSLGKSSIVITDTKDQPQTHWSIAAVARANPGETPAIFHPDGDPGETLELGEGEAQMIDAIETLRKAVHKARPRPGRLRFVGSLGVFAALVAGAVLWVPEAVRDHAMRVVPLVKREEIGENLIAALSRMTGPACSTPEGDAVLAKLSNRIAAPDGSRGFVVVRDGVKETLLLPGGFVLMNKSLVEDYDSPDVAAGYLVVERMRYEVQSPFRRFIDDANLWTVFQLLTRGEVSEAAYRAHAETLLTTPPADLPEEALIAAFTTWSVPATPYAYAKDITGESTLPLIEADPFRGTPAQPILKDSDWLRLQSICGG